MKEDEQEKERKKQRSPNQETKMCTPKTQEESTDEKRFNEKLWEQRNQRNTLEHDFDDLAWNMRKTYSI